MVRKKPRSRKTDKSGATEEITFEGSFYLRHTRNPLRALSKERSDIKKVTVNLVYPEGNSSEDSDSIKFQVMAVREQEGGKGDSTGGALAPADRAGCRAIDVKFQNKRLALTISGGVEIREIRRVRSPRYIYQ